MHTCRKPLVLSLFPFIFTHKLSKNIENEHQLFVLAVLNCLCPQAGATDANDLLTHDGLPGQLPSGQDVSLLQVSIRCQRKHFYEILLCICLV